MMSARAESEHNMRTRFAVLLISSVLVMRPLLPTQAQTVGAAFSVADVEQALKSGIPNVNLIALVKQRGVDFKLTDAVEKRLRMAGANGDVLLEITRAKRSAPAQILQSLDEGQRTTDRSVSSTDVANSSLTDLLKSADMGQVEAMFELGNRYSSATGGAAKDEASASAWYRKAAERGDARSEAELANIYYLGKGVLQDYSQAELWSRKAADQGDSFGQYQLALLYNEGKGVVLDKAQAISLMTIAAGAGQPEAQVWLGDAYLQGKGIDRNYRQALGWYAEAARKDDSAGEVKIGIMYSDGYAVAHDCSQAAMWFLKASDKGYPAAQVALGDLYLSGKGIPRDYSRAEELYRKAAGAGNLDAMGDLGGMHQLGLGVESNLEVAAKWYRQAAQAGSQRGQFILGLLYLQGRGDVPQNYAEAVQWLQKAAEQGFAPAQNQLGILYFNGLGVPKSMALSAEWRQKAINQDFAPAMREAARAFVYTGSYPEAEQWFEKAELQEAFDKNHQSCGTLEEYSSEHLSELIPYTKEPLQWKSSPEYTGVRVASWCKTESSGANEIQFNLHNDRPWLIEIHIYGEPDLHFGKYRIRAFGPNESMWIAKRAVRTCAETPTLKFDVAYDAKGDTAKLEYSESGGLRVKKDHSFDIGTLIQAATLGMNAAVLAKETKFNGGQTTVSTLASAHTPTLSVSSTARPVTSPQGLTTSSPHANDPGNNLPVSGQPPPSTGGSKVGGGNTKPAAGQVSPGAGSNGSPRSGQQVANGPPSSGARATEGCATGVPGDGPAGGGGSGNCGGQGTGTALPSPRAFLAGAANQTVAGAGFPTGIGSVSVGSPGAAGCVPGDGPAGGCNGNVQTTAEVAAKNTDSTDAFPAQGNRESGGSTNTDAGAGAMNSPESSAGAASNVGGSSNPGGWNDPLAADVASSNGAPASNDGSAYPVPTEEEIADALNTGVSNFGEVSATPVATVADSNNWNQFSSSSETSPSSSSASSPSTSSDTDAPAPDATDQQIERDMAIAGKDKDALAEILPTNDISDNITEQGIAVVGSVAHQINNVINDADSSGIFSIGSPGSSASVEQMNSDIVEFTPAIGNTFANAIPGYKYATTVNQDVTNLQNYAEKKVQSISCLFSFDPYCK
jgi:TPR repeat protein